MKSEALDSYSSAVDILQELLIKAHSNQTPQEMTRLESLLSSEEAALFEAGRISMSAFSRWRFGGRPLAQRGALKRRLDGGRVNTYG